MVERLKEIWLDAKQMRDERGLTLIELLVVVVILGIIAAIAVVAIGGLIENSRKDAVVSMRSSWYRLRSCTLHLIRFKQENQLSWELTKVETQLNQQQLAPMFQFVKSH